MTTQHDRASSDTDAAPPVLELRGVTKWYPGPRRRIGGARQQLRAVDGVDLTVVPGTTLGLVGESGSGKSTLARLSLRLVEPTSGSVSLWGHDVTDVRSAELRKMRTNAQMVFQDPYSSFDPLAIVGASLMEPLVAHTDMTREQRRRRVDEVLRLVGLPTSFAERYPRQLSGGQLQRAAIGRALIVEPKLLVLDEPVSALDVSTQAQIINLLVRLQSVLGVSYLFIAHDLAVVRHVSDRIAVMYLGRIVEHGPAEEVYLRPTHPYTMSLLSAILEPDPPRQRARRRILLNGDVPSPLDTPAGCRFHTRCPFVMDICKSVDPPHFVNSAGNSAACHLHEHGPTLKGATVRGLLGTPQPQCGTPHRAAQPAGLG